MNEENVIVIEENMEEVIEEVVEEPVEEVVENVQEVEKPLKKKRTQSQKQIDAFVKAREKRAENVLLRKSQSEEAKELLKSEKRKSKKTKELEQAIKSTVTVLDEEQVISIINSQKQKRNSVKQSKIDEYAAARKLLGIEDEGPSKPQEPVRREARRQVEYDDYDRYDNRREVRYDDRLPRRPRYDPRLDERLNYDLPSRPIQDEVISIINSQKQKRSNVKQSRELEAKAFPVEPVKPVKKPRAPRKPRAPKAKPFEEPTDPSPKNPQELHEFLKPFGDQPQANPYDDW